jgi:hypothetical protein
VAGAAFLGAAAGALHAATRRRGPSVPAAAAAVAVNAAAAAAVFAALQETARASDPTRPHGPLNSAVAGAATGAILARVHLGPAQRGAVLAAAAAWAPACAAGHWANDRLRLARGFKRWLVDQGLLDERMVRAAEEEEEKAVEAAAASQWRAGEADKAAEAAAAAAAPSSSSNEEEEEDGLTWRERRALVEQLRLREMAELADRMEAEDRRRRREANAAAAASSSGG